MKDYYSLLGIDSSATKAEVKKNYRLLANKYHPDKSDDPNSPEKFILITEAYDVLSNKKSRTQYDLYRWAKLKSEKESKESFNTVVPPFESTRSRRNKAQKKRSINYHQTRGESHNFLGLFIESVYIFGRYIFHILGITILIAILSSAIGQLAEIFEEGIIRGFVIILFLCAILYCIYWLLSNVYLEWNKDTDTFAVFFKISKNKAVNFTLFVAAIVIVLYALVLKISF